jgi:VanZ family protein
MRPPRALLHLARLVDGFLFWPTMTAVIWGELTGKEPNVVGLLNDKVLHFMAYFALAAMAAAAFKERRPVVLAGLGLMLLGGLLEILQGLVGRDMSAFDELANVAGILVGGVVARICVEYLRRRWT